MHYTWPSVLQPWTEVLDNDSGCESERQARGKPYIPETSGLGGPLASTVCFAGHCYASHDEAVHAVQHDAPLTLARWMPTDLD